jgi:RNA polymerase sigma-70 factor (ECF subfamily)
MVSSSILRPHGETLTTTLGAEEEDWDVLITLTADGNQSAFSTLYDRSSPRVYGLAMRILGDQGAAEEVTLDVFVQVWLKASDFDRSRGSAVAWLLTIARRRVIDRLRSVQSGRHHGDSVESLDSLDNLADEGHDPEMLTVLNERERLVRKAISRLSDVQRECLLLAYFSGLSHVEIAARLGIPAGTIKTRIRLGMQKLREWLAPLSPHS